MKWIKRIFVTLAVIIGLVTAILHLTDSTYLWTGVRTVYLRGQTMVGIYDYKAQNTRAIKTGEGQPWELDVDYNEEDLSEEIMKIHEELKTTAFLVIKDGRLLTEKYFQSSHKEDRIGLWSVTKTYTTFAILKAIEDGLIESIDDPVKKYIPEWDIEQNPTLTLRHLASMSAGLYWDEMDKSPFSLIAKYNFYDDLDGLSVKSLYATGKPGEIQHYNSGATQLLGTILGRVWAPNNLSDYLSEKFWQPLGCEQEALFVLDSDKHGAEKAFGGMAANARGVARLGQVLLDNGKWKDQIILSPEHVDLVKKVPYNNRTYSYGLWTGIYEGERFYFQAGFKGQLIITVPSENMVVVRLGHDYYPKADLEDLPREVFDYIKEGVRIADKRLVGMMFLQRDGC